MTTIRAHLSLACPAEDSTDGASLPILENGDIEREIERETIQIQPNPTMTRVVYFRFSRWTITAIMRHWKPGDSGPGGRCKLCPKCSAVNDGCLKVVGRYVPRYAASLFSAFGLVRQAR